VRDNETGLDFMEARYFSSAQGRFTIPDWASKEEWIPYATLDDPQSLNLYAYVRNNPVSRFDLDGHCDSSGHSDINGPCQSNCQGLTGSAWNKCNAQNAGNTPQPGKKKKSLGDKIVAGAQAGAQAVGGAMSDISNALNSCPLLVIAFSIYEGKSDVLEKEGPELEEEMGAVAESGSNYVYQIVQEGKTVYVGITNDLQRRGAEHGAKLEQIVDGLTRSQARGVEQALIEQFGLQKNGGALLNKINSISPSNPTYKELVQFGRQLLQSINYSGK
jgi:RHS repeat-associated protein